MAFQMSPGVSVTEKDISLIVPAVASTGGGIVSPFQWGPAKIPVLVGTQKEMATMFGAPVNSAYAAAFWFCAANFLSYGNNLKVVRFITASDLNACSGTVPSQIANLDEYADPSASTAGAWIARYPGAMGNTLKVVVLDSLNTTLDNTDTVADENEYSDYLKNFDGIPGTSTWAAGKGYSTAKDEIHILVIDEDGLLTGVRGTILERYQYLSKAKDSQKEDGSTNYFKNVINDQSEYVYWGHVDGLSYGSGTAWDQNIGATAFKILTAAKSVKSLTGGADTTFSASNDSAIAGYYSTYFGDPETIDVSFFIAGPLGASAASTVIDVAASRKDCMAFVSPITLISSTPYVNLTAATTYRSTLTASSYGVMDSGYKFQYDKYYDIYRYVPLCGDIAGCCVRTDIDRDPWYSPAGYERGRILNAIKLAYNPSKTHRDELYKKGINPVVQFDGSGIILFGDKTLLQKPSAFDRINVRRLFIVLEKAIATASKFLLFEFNDEFTRSQFKLLVEPFLRSVQSRRGIQDFKVVCDETNNTAQVIDSNNFVADIYIKPNRSINFIQLNFIATATGISFEEVVGA